MQTNCCSPLPLDASLIAPSNAFTYPPCMFAIYSPDACLLFYRHSRPRSGAGTERATFQTRAEQALPANKAKRSAHKLFASLAY